MLSTGCPDPCPAAGPPAPPPPRYLGQPDLLGLLQLEDTTGLQEGDKGQTLGLVNGGELLLPADLAVGVMELGEAEWLLCCGTAPRGDARDTHPLPQSSPGKVPLPLTFPSVTSRARRRRVSRSREQSSNFCCRGKVSWAPRPSPASRSPNTSEMTREMCRSPTRLGTGDAGESPAGQTRL